MKKVLAAVLFLTLISGCTSTENPPGDNCNGVSVEKCPQQCVVCPPCETCSTLTCQTEEKCSQNGFEREWYEGIETFEECMRAGGSVLESLPRQCNLINRTFVEPETPPSQRDVDKTDIDFGGNNSKSNFQDNCLGFVVGGPDETKEIENIGGTWARPHPGPFAWEWIETTNGNFNFEETDKWVLGSQENNVAILATLWPFSKWDQEKCHDGMECEVDSRDIFYPGLFDNNGIPLSRCVPCNFDDYKEFLTKLVERYDGDGIDDMPHLVLPIKHWEISNEPSMQGGHLTFFKGSEEEYVQILKASFEAIKKACQDCKVVQGGSAGNHQEAASFWRKVFEIGGGEYFDIANIHFVKFGDVNTLNVKEFKKLMIDNGIDKPVWVTEAEFQPGEDIESAFVGALNAGASKIFLTRLIIGKKISPDMDQYKELYEKIPDICITDS